MGVTKGKCGCQTTIVEGHRLADYMCPKHKATPDMYEALEGIAEGKGRFDCDRLKHASNTIDDMKELANEALAKAKKK